MKKLKQLQIILLTGAMVLAFAGCAQQATETAGSVVSTGKTSSDVSGESATQGGNLVEGSKATMEKLNQVLKDYNLYDEAYCFQDSYTFNDFETCAVYRTTGIMGMNSIVVYQKAEDKYYAIDLGDYSTHTVQYVNPVNEQPNTLGVNMKGYYFGGDYIYEHFMQEQYFDISTGKLKQTLEYQAPGTFGMVDNRDQQKFKTCETAGNMVTFTFEVAPGSTGNGYPGPEITIAQEGFYPDEQGRTSGTVHFLNTEQNLTAEMVESMNKLEGVESVSVTYSDALPFAGTTIAVKPKEGYKISYLFNKSGAVNILEDFSISCVRIEEEAKG